MDNAIMMSVQIAIIGIVVVVGLFVLWRRIARLEERVEALSNMQRLMGGSMAYDNMNEDADDLHARGTTHMPDEDIMAAIFDMPLSSMKAGIEEEPAGVTVVSTTASSTQQKEQVAVSDAVPESHDPETHGLSKTKLRKMAIDEIKLMLEARGLPTEGNKATLIDRLHAAEVASVASVASESD